MKVTTRVVIDIISNEVVEREGYNYEGPLAQCSSRPKTTVPSGTQGRPSIGFFPEAASKFGGALSSAIDFSSSPTGAGLLTQRAIDQAVQTSRSGFAARGLAGSGIAQRAEQELATDVALKGAGQQQAFLASLLSPSVGGGQAVTPQPRGLFGLK